MFLNVKHWQHISYQCNNYQVKLKYHIFLELFYVCLNIVKTNLRSIKTLTYSTLSFAFLTKFNTSAYSYPLSTTRLLFIQASKQMSTDLGLYFNLKSSFESTLRKQIRRMLRRVNNKPLRKSGLVLF